MKAIQAIAFGGPEQVRITDIPRPEAQPGQVLIRVRGAGVNLVDSMIRGGGLPFLNIQPPFTLGCDVAGVVEESKSDKFQKGDEVYAYLALNRNGAYAEFAIALEGELARKPSSLTFVEAAAVPVAALTAWQSIFDLGHLASGQTILIHGAAGGVGAMAVQLAKWKGARVIGTASGANLEYLRNLGADETIDYRSERFEDRAGQVDVVFDTVGGETLERSVAVVRKGGFLVSASGQVPPERAAAAGITAAMVGVQPNGARLAEISNMVEAGTLSTRIDRVFAFTSGLEALAVVETGGAKGKIVIEVDNL